MKKCLIALNAIALATALTAWLYAERVVELRSISRVTELDRSGVINTEKLRTFDPILADNPRYNLGRWIADPEKRIAVGIAQTAAIVSALNLLMVSLPRKS